MAARQRDIWSSNDKMAKLLCIDRQAALLHLEGKCKSTRPYVVHYNQLNLTVGGAVCGQTQYILVDAKVDLHCES